MVEQQLRRRGIDDERVLNAMASVPREMFVGEAFAAQAYNDSPLPIGEKQTISQPYVVAYMAAQLELTGTEKVLEIGTGTGYNAAILSSLSAQVYTIERHSTLSFRARQLLDEFGCRNVLTKVGDGTLGWREYAGFDAILVAAAGPEIPPLLVEQLAVGGRMIIPVGNETLQNLIRVHKHEDGSTTQLELGGVRFVPLIGRFGWKRTDLDR